MEVSIVRDLEWTDDKEKNGEVFSNSYCLTYCIKHFIKERRVEIWDHGSGYYLAFESNIQAKSFYQSLKYFSEKNIEKVKKEKMFAFTKQR
jgi:hypothetical protein